MAAALFQSTLRGRFVSLAIMDVALRRGAERGGLTFPVRVQRAPLDESGAVPALV
jgi:hypothetical protein